MQKEVEYNCWRAFFKRGAVVFHRIAYLTPQAGSGPKKAAKNIPERAGFDLPSLCNILVKLILQLNSSEGKDLNRAKC